MQTFSSLADPYKIWTENILIGLTMIKYFRFKLSFQYVNVELGVCYDIGRKENLNQKVRACLGIFIGNK